MLMKVLVVAHHMTDQLSIRWNIGSHNRNSIDTWERSVSRLIGRSSR